MDRLPTSTAMPVAKSFPTASVGKSCITITFSDTVENGVGMQKLGRNAGIGTLFTTEYLQSLQAQFPGSEIIDLDLPTEHIPVGQIPDKACLLVIRGYCGDPFSSGLLRELLALEWDKKALFRGQVKNKNARHNLCFANEAQVSDYERGKGTVVSFNSLPHLMTARDAISTLLPSTGVELNAEGNLYYDISKTYIGLHGDTERDFVIGLRLGTQIPLHFRWFYQTKGICPAKTVYLNDGDLYIMSHKATGNDWKKRSICTLRHAAGNEKLIKKLRD